MSLWKNFFWRGQRCKYSKQNTTVLVVTVAFATAPENYATTNDISCQAALAHIRTDKPLLCSVCLGVGGGSDSVLPLLLLSVIMIIHTQHSTSGFVEQHLSSQIRSDFPQSPRSPIIRFLFPVCPSPLPWAFFFLSLVSANHTQEGCRC